MKTNKVCPLVVRERNGDFEILAFQHPCLDYQLVKGTIELNEKPENAAVRELYEESGLRVAGKPQFLACTDELPDANVWYFYLCRVTHDPQENWNHLALDDGGHTFSFFWHRISENLNDSWHPLFHRVFSYVKPNLLSEIQDDQYGHVHRY